MAERPRSRSFGPTVLLGLAGATLAAIAGAKDWGRASSTVSGTAASGVARGSDTAPLVVALALVALAAWGVVLVVRGRPRRVVAVLGLLAAAGALLSTVTASGQAQDDAVAAAVAQGAGADAFTSSLTAWYFAAAVGALLALGAFIVAVRALPSWPAMGSRYDAPAARTQAEAAAPTTERDMWRTLDDGHDPTA
ncbi:MAG: Trp biosynthesis-associated membrane protein [Nocardioidaceae bacterium]